MTNDRRTILIDARVNWLPGAHGLARSVMRLAEHVGPDADGRPVRVLVDTADEPIFPLDRLTARVPLVETDIAVGAFHRAGELARVIRAVGAAVLYVPHPMLRPLWCPCPTVVTLHDCTVERDVAFAAGRHRQLAQKIATRAVLRRADAVTTPTRASLAEVLEHYPSAPNPTVVPNGVDTHPFDGVTAAMVAAARERYRLPDRFVLAVGAHRPHKNHVTLVRAMCALPPTVSLVIAGRPDPHFPQPVAALVAELGLGARVMLLPTVDDALLPAVYRAAAAVALPSLAEGFGLPALEALAAGTPLVASDIAVLAEVCAGAATLVPALDPAAWAAALAAAVDGGPRVRAQVEAGRAVAAAASWATGGRALRGLLGRVASGRRTA